MPKGRGIHGQGDWMIKGLKYFIYSISIIFFLIASIIGYLLWFQPQFNFPKPTGPYAVGTTEYHWIDNNRKEIYSNDPEHPSRELMVRIWYPAEGSLPEKPIRFELDMAENFKKNDRLIYLLGLSRPLNSYVVPEALLLNNSLSFPIIIFSPGAMGSRDSNIVQCEELSSHGYIVIGISHTFDCHQVRFPDGRTIKMNQREQGKNFEQRRAIINEDLEIRIADTRFIIDQLEKLNIDPNSKFYQKLNHQIGIFGQSMGGATAIQSCRRDSRIKAAINMDGSLFGPDPLKPFDKPLMFIIAGNTLEIFKNNPMKKDDWKRFNINSLEEDKMVQEIAITASKNIAKANVQDVNIISIQNASHHDFTTLSLLKEATVFAKVLRLLGVCKEFGIGSINGFHVNNIVNDYLINFFNKYLKGNASTLLDNKEKVYPEVENIENSKDQISTKKDCINPTLYHIKYLVPYIAQNDDYSCATTSLAMAISYFENLDKPLDKDIVWKILGSDKNDIHQYGNDMDGLKRIADHYGFKSEFKDNMEIFDIEKLLSQKSLVVLNISVSNNSSAIHALLVTGYDKNKKIFYVNDPANKQNKEMKYSDLQDRWKAHLYSLRGNSFHSGFIIYPKT
jgi:dienelactone hydrolase/predicted double-glycine peptidase